MSGFFSELNANAGAIQAITAIVLVAVTIWYAVLTRSVAKSSVEAQRPYVYVDITGGGRTRLEFSIGNDGSRAAQNITLRLDTKGSDYLDGQLRNLGVFETGISYLAPSRTYRYAVELEDLGIFKPASTEEHVVLSLQINYVEGKRSYSDSFRLDISALSGVLLSSFSNPTLVIANEIKSIARTMDRQASQGRMSRLMSGNKCPLCHESIAHGAIRCSHCHEWIAERVAPEAAD